MRDLRDGRYDKVVRVPIVHPTEFLLPDGRAVDADRVTTATDEFLRAYPTPRVIGVTGTKGKSTTSSLITTMIAATGAPVRTGGNNGTSPLDLLTHSIDPDEWVVLELANFQLIDLRVPVPNMVLLPVDLDHLDWHRNEKEYLEAKLRPFRIQRSNDQAFLHTSHRARPPLKDIASRAVFYPDADVAHVRDGWVWFGTQRLLPTRRLALPGTHSLVNVCAALTTVVSLLGWHREFVDVLESFRGCRHRLDDVPVISEYRWVDDSAATTPAASAAALRTISAPTVMIVGGVDKALSIAPLTDAMMRAHAVGQLRGAVTIGSMALRLTEALRSEVPALPVRTVAPPKRMDAAVEAAQSLASPGDCILLSPGFASLDQYESYAHRSAEFRAAIGSVE